jgi:hypothetical protein
VELRQIELVQEVTGFLHQSNISEGNLLRLKEISGAEDMRCRHLADLVLQVARLHPRRRKRLRYLAYNAPDLLNQLSEAGLVLADEFGDTVSVGSARCRGVARTQEGGEPGPELSAFVSPAGCE